MSAANVLPAQVEAGGLLHEVRHPCLALCGRLVLSEVPAQVVRARVVLPQGMCSLSCTWQVVFLITDELSTESHLYLDVSC